MRSSGLNLWLAAGWLIFLCSFVIPAFRPDAGSSVSLPAAADVGLRLHVGPESITGWEAMRSAFDSGTYGVISATTNVLIVLSLLGLASQGFAARFVWVVGAATVFNLWWIQALGKDRVGLHVGYFAWILSFAFVSMGLYCVANKAGTRQKCETPV